MTDYLYGLSLATQTKGFLLSMGLGFLMGFFYDVFRLIRLSISRKKILVIVFDLLYCIFLCFSTFLFCMTVNEGQLRFSGQPYIIHPIAVSKILADYGMDKDSIIAV